MSAFSQFMATVIFFGVAGVIVTLISSSLLGQQSTTDIIVGVGVICIVFIILGRLSMRENNGN